MKEPKMPNKTEILKCDAANPETLAQHLVSLGERDLTRPVQYTALARILAAYLPATVTLEQRSPRSVIYAHVQTPDDEQQFRVDHAGNVTFC